MRWRPLVRDVWDGARRHPARILLPFTGIALGMFALAVLLGVVAGLRRQAHAAIAELGVNTFAILQAGEAAAPVAPLTRRHADLLRRNLPGHAVTAYRASPCEVLGRPAVLVRADEHLWLVRPWVLRAGRALDSADIRNHAASAVVSETLAREAGLSPGSALPLGPATFRVVGIVSVESGALDQTAAAPSLSPGERLVIVPGSVPAYWTGTPEPAEDSPDAIFVRGGPSLRLGESVTAARRLLSDPRYAASPLSWVTPSSLVARLERLRRVILAAGGFIAGLCLLMGGITLGSLMLANVQSRIPEIGLRRALGAAPLDICLLFLLEALFLAGCATALGAGAAAALLRLTYASLPVPVATGPFLLGIPLTAGLLLGIAFSLAPARAAARIAPAEALRNE